MTTRTDDGRRVFRRGAGLSDGLRAELRATAAEIDQRLAATIPENGGDVVVGIVEQIDASFAGRFDPQAALAILGGFVMALAGRSDAACREALRRILRGEAAGFSPTFPPKAAELARLAIAIEREWTLERDRLEWLASLPEMGEELPAPQPTAEEMVAVRERARRLMAAPRTASPVIHRGDGSPAARVASEIAERKASRMQQEVTENE